MNPPLIEPYLTFGGRCEEALEFYKNALGAQIDFMMRFHESPDAAALGRVPPGFEKKIMHASFHIGQSALMASDGDETGVKFSGFTLSLSAANEAEAKRFFDALAVNGKVSMPLAKTFWSPCFGMVTDRFGLGWMVSVAGANA